MLYFKRIQKILASEVKEDEADSALMTESDKFKKFGPIVKVFKSKSNPNKSYEVRRLKGKDPTCNCPGWANRRKCKHIDDVIKNKIAATAAIEVSPVNRPKDEADSVRDILDRYQKKQAKSVVASIEKILGPTAVHSDKLQDLAHTEITIKIGEVAQSMLDSGLDLKQIKNDNLSGWTDTLVDVLEHKYELESKLHELFEATPLEE